MVEVYMDDKVVKIRALEDHPSDIQQVLASIKLDPEKYTLGVKSSKFLGYIVSDRA